MTIRSPFDVDYSLVHLFGKDVLVTSWRIDKELVPKGLYVYELRDMLDGRPCQLRENIWVNFYGTVLSKEPIELDGDGSRIIEWYDITNEEAVDTPIFDSEDFYYVDNGYDLREWMEEEK